MSLNMRQSTSTSVSIPVRVKATPSSWEWTTTVQVQPEGKPQRLAKAGEVEVRLQYEWGMSAWTSDDRWIKVTDAAGKVTITTAAGDMKFPGKYRVRALHLASGASVTREIHLDGYGGASIHSQQTENQGDEMPFEFAKGPGRPSGGLAVPEVIQWPRSGSQGMPGVEYTVRQRGGYVDLAPRI